MVEGITTSNNIAMIDSVAPLEITEIKIIERMCAHASTTSNKKRLRKRKKMRKNSKRRSTKKRRMKAPKTNKKKKSKKTKRKTKKRMNQRNKNKKNPYLLQSVLVKNWCRLLPFSARKRR